MQKNKTVETDLFSTENQVRVVVRDGNLVMFLRYP